MPGGRLPQISAQWGESELTPVIYMINDRLSRVLTARERDESNLVLMADILFRFMAIDIGAGTRRRTGRPAPDGASCSCPSLLLARLRVARPVAADAPGSSSVDSDYDRFLNGQVVVPYYLLKQINISLCQNLMMQLSRPQYRSLRAVMLILIIEQCRSKIRLDR